MIRDCVLFRDCRREATTSTRATFLLVDTKLNILEFIYKLVAEQTNKKNAKLSRMSARSCSCAFRVEDPKRVNAMAVARLVAD